MRKKRQRWILGFLLLIFAWTSSCGEPIPVDCATEEECTTENEGGFQTGTAAGLAAGGAAVAVLAGGAISGGGEGSSGGGGSSGSSNTLSTLTGTLIDSAVAGASYNTSSGLSGLTSSSGGFSYRSGDLVTFTIGSIPLGTTTGASVVTPIELAGVQTSNHQKVINLIRFLQTLDTDLNPTNGITISSSTRSSLYGRSINFDQTTTRFESATNTTLRNTSIERGLVDAENAISHFHNVLANRGRSEQIGSIAVPLPPKDSQSPSNGNIRINNGSTSTTSSSVTLSLSATDNVGITAYYASSSSSTPSASASGWTTVTTTTNHSASVSFTLSSGSGTKTVYAWFKDAAGNVSTRYSDSISYTILDTQPPTTGSISINSGASSTTSSSVSLSLSATDNIGVTAYYLSSSSSTPSASSSGWINITATTNYSSSSISFTLGSGYGTKNIYAWFKDAAGNVSSRYSDSIEYAPVDDHSDSASDATTLTIGSSQNGTIGTSSDIDYFIINPSNSGTLKLYTTGSLNPYAFLYVGNNSGYSKSGYLSGSGISYTVTAGASYLLKIDGIYSSIGNYVIHADFIDNVAPSTGSISINSGASSTSSTSVTLSLSATDNVGVTAYYLSSSSSTPSASSSGWTNITTTTSYSSSSISFTLAGTVGTNTIYIWFKDAAGNISSRYSDSISYVPPDDHGDTSSSATILPIGSSVAGTIGMSSDYDYFLITPKNSGTLRIYTTGNINPYGYLYVGNSTSYSRYGYLNGSGFSHTVTGGTNYYLRVTSSSTGSYTVYAEEVDTQAPTGSISINGGAASTSSTSVTLTLSATDNVGITAYYISTYLQAPSLSSTSWVSITPTTSYISAPIPYTFSAGSGSKYVYAWFKDAEGNLSGRNDATIIFASNDDHSDGSSGATVLSVGSSASGTIDTTSDWDYFAITPVTSGYVQIYTTGNTDTYGTLYSGSTQVASNDDRSDNDTNFLITHYVTTGVTYYLEVKGLGGAMGDYSLYAEIPSSGNLPFGSSWTFTNANATGRLGPTQANVSSAYSSSSLSGQVTVNTRGYQEWIVPASGTYQIEAWGAAGGVQTGSDGDEPGRGAKMRGDFSLTAGERLIIEIGRAHV